MQGAWNPYQVVRGKAGFSGKNSFCPKNLENGAKMGQKQGFFKFIEKFGH